MITSVARSRIYIEEANKNSEVKKYLGAYSNFFDGIRSLVPVINSKSAYRKQGR